MEITETKIYLKETGGDKKLKAFATITIDNAFVVRDLKIIEGKKGLFVAMPSSKVTEPCPNCRKKNPVKNHYCGSCGKVIGGSEPDEMLNREDHRDIAHPINNEAREYLHKVVTEAYNIECKKKDS